MFVRLIVENYCSFGERQEFSTIINSAPKRLQSHVYKFGKHGLSRFSAIYGANGSGKSNFIDAVSAVSELATGGTIERPFKKFRSKTRISNESVDMIFLIEFIVGNQAYVYQISVNNDVITSEELMLSGFGKTDDISVFSREINADGDIQLQYGSVFFLDEKDAPLAKVLEKNLIKSNKSVLQTVYELENNKSFIHVLEAYRWFDTYCLVVTPQMKAAGITKLMSSNDDFKSFCSDVFASIDVGIDELEIFEQTLDEFIRDGNTLPNEQLKNISDGKTVTCSDQANRGVEILVQGDKGLQNVKRIRFLHKLALANELIPFEGVEESDGTLRLLNLLPLLYLIVKRGYVGFVDEIERSIHPSLIKAIFKWLTSLGEMKGQLIFTTHESGLLDFGLFKQDEIWFCEKDQNGNSKIYSLAEFKEHHTIDARKGYLSGRYGGIPKITNFNRLVIK